MRRTAAVLLVAACLAVGACTRSSTPTPEPDWSLLTRSASPEEIAACTEALLERKEGAPGCAELPPDAYAEALRRVLEHDKDALSSANESVPPKLP
ncbi:MULTISPECIES: hypothetical protein [Streptomyces]|uniref:Secreted protein n=1 Tax=Streptomyces thermoviolaceus subsp. thermoviolaceus TaxID=66860 RepID=A0ABX0YYI7_STRTL|nr:MULTISPECIES: hypothetical protein [Streptomyces]MCM3266045.1 hypothetical protein [Streptomyces thermoviolaceus]NJP16251.1 hypothetical protein [Streptomyces thermoviolaceus subsp. thermoviolaceus]RSS08196.1 hypothetical protein EF917_02835 [Streptomyces sp. WAC00469]WTD50519.1 hypothetical protein OG899_25190 [Streptomyces thermoviolaceus]GGV82620.1 hypothetical protein GCM10010499_48670 [Streptomyces thermoviolaceus subsp. apingens]